MYDIDDSVWWKFHEELVAFIPKIVEIYKDRLMSFGPKNPKNNHDN